MDRRIGAMGETTMDHRMGAMGETTGIAGRSTILVGATGGVILVVHGVMEIPDSAPAAPRMTSRRRRSRSPRLAADAQDWRVAAARVAAAGRCAKSLLPCRSEVTAPAASTCWRTRA